MELRPLRRVRKIRGSLSEVLMMPSEDYVSVTLTDTVDLDVLDMQDRLRNAFPNLLEIRRETERRADYRAAENAARRERDPFELCLDFLGELLPGEEELLRDVMNTVSGEGEEG